MQIIDATTPEQFQQLLAEHPRVLVDFHKDQCPGCRMLEVSLHRVANSVAAIEAGANRIDAAAAGLGAGAGNTPMEVLVAVLDRMGIQTGVDVWKIQDVAEDLVVPLMDFPIRIDRDALTLGYAGVYGSFLLFAKRAEKKYGVPARELLLELGRRGMVGGQEDMIEDTAITMARARGLNVA